MTDQQEKKTVRIQGRVINRDTNTGIDGLTVEAWDKDHASGDDYLGVTKQRTRGGYFELEFDAAKAKAADPIDEPLRLYFRVRRKDQLIAETSWTCNADTGSRVINATILIREPERAPADPPPPPPPAPEVTIEDAVIDVPITWPPGAPRSAADFPLRQVIEDAAAEVIGPRSRRDGGEAFQRQLERAFVPREVDGREEFDWVAPSFARAVRTDQQVALTGDQAVLYNRAKSGRDEVLRHLRELEPLRPDFDEEEGAAIRAIMSTLITELVDELSYDAGLREARVDGLLDLLGENLEELKREFGLKQAHVLTLDEDNNYTKGLVIADYVSGLQHAWDDYTSRRGDPTQYLGTQVVLLNRALECVAESVDDAYRALAASDLGPTELQTVTITYPGAETPPLTIDALLSWARWFAVGEAKELIQKAGRLGIKAIKPTAETLHRLVEGALTANVPHPNFKRGRVQRAFRDLAANLSEVARLAGALHGERQANPDGRQPSGGQPTAGARGDSQAATIG